MEQLPCSSEVTEDKGNVTDELSRDFQGVLLCPLCEKGYLVNLKAETGLSNQKMDTFYQLCINGCGSEQAGAICINENAKIAKEMFKKTPFFRGLLNVNLR